MPNSGQGKHQENERQHLLSDFEIDTSELETISSGLRSPELKSPARVYLQNLQDLLFLIAMPLAILADSEQRKDRLILEIAAVLNTKSLYVLDESEEARGRVNDELKRLQAKLWADRAEKRKQHFDAAEAKLSDWFRVPIFKRSGQMLLYVACSSAWTYYESFVKDVWISCLNSRPYSLGQPALGDSSPKVMEDGLSAKSISVGILARYGFNLTASLGTLLSSKYDFSGVSGSQAAYAAAFKNGLNLPAIFGFRDLQLLEATRHLIVHQAGRIDEEYLKRTGRKTRRGSRLIVTSRQTAKLIHATVRSASVLLSDVDSWLQSNPKK